MSLATAQSPMGEQMLHLCVSDVASRHCHGGTPENRRVTDGPRRQSWCAMRARFAEASNAHELKAAVQIGASRESSPDCLSATAYPSLPEWDPSLPDEDGGGKRGASVADTSESAP